MFERDTIIESFQRFWSNFTLSEDEIIRHQLVSRIRDKS